MIMRRMTWAISVFVMVAILAAVSYAKPEEKGEHKGKEHKEIKEGKVAMSEVPPAVQAAIEKEAAGAKIDKIEVEDEDGQAVYEAKWARDGKKVEAKFSATGSIIKEEDEENEKKEEAREEGGKEEKIEMSAAPAAVQETVAKVIGAGKLTDLVAEVEDGVKMFEAEYTTADGMKNSVVMDANGTICEKEEQVKALPPAVKAAIEKMIPGAQIGEACAATKTVYEVKVTMDGKEKEIKVSPAGQVEKAKWEKKFKEEKKHKEGKKHDKDGGDDEKD